MVDLYLEEIAPVDKKVTFNIFLFAACAFVAIVCYGNLILAVLVGFTLKIAFSASKLQLLSFLALTPNLWMI